SGIYSHGDNDTLTITNNRTVNGGRGIAVQGTNYNALSNALLVDNNIIEDFGYYGLYVYYTDSCIITNNKIHASSINGTGYGMYFYYIFNKFEIANNSVNMVKGSIGTKYGMRLAMGNYYYYVSNGSVAGGTGLVYNNVINVRAGNTSTKYGIYSYYNDNVKFYYNTAVIANGGGINSRALNQYNSTLSTNGEIFINNSFVDSVGTYAGYFMTPLTINSADYNNYYTAGGNIGYWNSAQATLADLQAASGKDAHSISVLPLTLSPSDLMLTSFNLSGQAMPITDVTTDYYGDARSTILPTIGFHEKTLLPINIGVVEVLNFPDTSYQGAQIPIVAQVKNFGTDTVYIFDVEYTLNSGTPVSVTFNDTLAPNTIESVLMPTLTSPAGNATFCATTVLATDSDAYNDGICYNFFAIPIKDAYL
ncbi:MAG: hypothetical protein KAH32_08555, partial [Chlamydiia bacterium]|nr:hypothetical protein [Chlamydiia bacterium]